VLGSLSRDGVEPAHPVICRQGSALAATFHPELTTDRRLHRLFLTMVRNRQQPRDGTLLVGRDGAAGPATATTGAGPGAPGGGR